ncbi:hypothetical protein [Kitasatospora sp. GAS1066B]|uniref:hypothetical protein n=1 Tax=Kitasatospora sp. GAS1066B TaxID=3156271 RepID=UPI003515E440
MTTRPGTSSPTRLEDSRPEPVTTSRPARSRSRRRAIWSSWSGAAVLAAAGLWTVNYGYGQDNPSNDGPVTASPEHPGLITPQGARSVVQAMSPRMGGSRVVEFWLSADSAYARAPVPGNPGLYDRFDYRGGRTTRDPSGSGTMSGEGVVLDLDAVAWDELPGLLQQTNPRG